MHAPRLRDWRLARGLSQAELSKLTGATEYTISRIENGAPLRPSTARRFATALDIDVIDLMENPPVAVGKAEPPRSGAAEDVPDSLADLLESSGVTTRHLVDPDLEQKLRYMPFEDAKRVVLETRDEYRAVLNELGRLEERVPHARTKITRLLSKSLHRLTDIRMALRTTKTGTRLIPLKPQYEPTDEGLMILPGEEDKSAQAVEYPPELEGLIEEMQALDAS